LRAGTEAIYASKNGEAGGELKKLDSFGRWMDKEMGGDCEDSLMASNSEVAAEFVTGNVIRCQAPFYITYNNRIACSEVRAERKWSGSVVNCEKCKLKDLFHSLIDEKKGVGKESQRYFEHSKPCLKSIFVHWVVPANEVPYSSVLSLSIACLIAASTAGLCCSKKPSDGDIVVAGLYGCLLFGIRLNSFTLKGGLSFLRHMVSLVRVESFASSANLLSYVNQWLSTVDGSDRGLRRVLRIPPSEGLPRRTRPAIRT
ncbi:hypothetical protein Tco_0958964, partial [Tanacetum coccineum]